MYYYLLKDSTRKDKKYMIQYINPDSGVFGNNIHFGAINYDDYTIHKDDNRKKNYIKRHQVNEDWSDLSTSGAWSRWILWNKISLDESIKDMEKRFGIKILFVINN